MCTRVVAALEREALHEPVGSALSASMSLLDEQGEYVVDSVESAFITQDWDKILEEMSRLRTKNEDLLHKNAILHERLLLRQEEFADMCSLWKREYRNQSQRPCPSKPHNSNTAHPH